MAHHWPKEPLTQFSLWASGTVNYDYIVTNSINLLIGLRCILNGTHTLTMFEPIWPKPQNLSKPLVHVIVKITYFKVIYK